MNYNRIFILNSSHSRLSLMLGNFLPIVITVGRQIPGISTVLDLPVISQAVDFLAGKSRPKCSV